MQSAQQHAAAGGPAPLRRSTTFRPVGIFVPKLVSETCRRRGFINVDIVLRWRDIVGRALARHTWPMRLEWPLSGERHTLRLNCVADYKCRGKVLHAVGVAP